MSIVVYADGNIGTEPEVRTTPTGKTVLSFSAYLDNPTKQDDGKYADKGGFWVRVDYWTDHAEAWKNLYRKGMRVSITGTLRRDEWKNEQGEPQVTMRLNAKRVSILPFRIASVEMKAKAEGETFDDDIPF